MAVSIKKRLHDIRWSELLAESQSTPAGLRERLVRFVRDHPDRAAGLLGSNSRWLNADDTRWMEEHFARPENNRIVIVSPAGRATVDAAELWAVLGVRLRSVIHLELPQALSPQ